jgi:hypothetical protein
MTERLPLRVPSAADVSEAVDTLLRMEIVVSLLALALSVASLTWQVITHALSGDRVVVQLGTSIPVGAIDYLPNCRSITAQNRGRTPVSVTSIALDVGKGLSAQIATHLVGPLSDPLPIRLEPGASASWAYPISVDDEVRQSHPRRRAVVSLGTGRRRHSKRG